MLPSQALEEIRNHATAGRYIISEHARRRMVQRGVSHRDIRGALTGAFTCEADGAKWKVTGPDFDGDSLTCVVVLEAGDVVVAVY